MTSIWVEAVVGSIDEALDLLAAAVQDCTDELWETPMWVVPAPDGGHEFLDANWQPVTDPDARRGLVEGWVRRRSAPWSVAWHALECLDYDLSGDLRPWAPPPPFAGHPHWRDLPSLPAAWPRGEIGGYIDYCRRQVRDTLTGMTEDQAATPLPSTHRYGGRPHASIITGFIGHTTEHAAQIRQFITTAGISPRD